MLFDNKQKITKNNIMDIKASLVTSFYSLFAPSLSAYDMRVLFCVGYHFPRHGQLSVISIYNHHLLYCYNQGQLATARYRIHSSIRKERPEQTVKT